MTIEVKALPFKEAVEFWQDKILLSPSAYNRLSDEAKMKAFAVSGIAKTDELTTVYNALDKALTQGISFNEFKNQCGDIFTKRGWTGVAAWRVENIFRTNIQSAYMAGRWEQSKATMEDRPYGQYSAVRDSRTRPLHNALHGKIYPLDHLFWDTWWPLNGHMCRCAVKTLSRRQVENSGMTVEEQDITGQLIEPIDPKTGKKMPARKLMPDPGWSYHPGKTVFGGITPVEAGPAKDIGLRTFADYKRKGLKNLPAKAWREYEKADLLEDIEKHMHRTGVTREAAEAYYAEQFLSEFGLKMGQEKVIADALGEPLIISEKLFYTAGGKIKVAKRGREKHMKLLARSIQEPWEIWLTPMRTPDGKVILRRRYITPFSSGPDNRHAGLAVFDYGKDGWSGVTTFTPDSLEYGDKLRNGVLLYKQ